MRKILLTVYDRIYDNEESAKPTFYLTAVHISNELVCQNRDHIGNIYCVCKFADAILLVMRHKVCPNFRAKTMCGLFKVIAITELEKGSKGRPDWIEQNRKQ